MSVSLEVAPAFCVLHYDMNITSTVTCHPAEGVCSPLSEGSKPKASMSISTRLAKYKAEYLHDDIGIGVKKDEQDVCLSARTELNRKWRTH